MKYQLKFEAMIPVYAIEEVELSNDYKSSDLALIFNKIEAINKDSPENLRWKVLADSKVNGVSEIIIKSIYDINATDVNEVILKEVIIKKNEES